MTEAELTREVLRLAKSAGVLAHHCRDSRHCDGDKGLPDVILAGERGLMIMELKSEDGESYASQDRWLWTLDRIGSLDMAAGIWRPSDLASGEIDLKLRSIA